MEHSILIDHMGRAASSNDMATVLRRDVLIADIRHFTLSYAAGLVFFTFFFG